MPDDDPHTEPTPQRPRRDRGRATFSVPELRRVLRRYDLPPVTGVRDLPAGDPRAPKAVIQTAGGRFLLKRRAPGHNAPAAVAFAHQVQLALFSAGFPVPALVGTREDNNSMLQLSDGVYELFRYVEGEPWKPTPARAASVGEAAQRFHTVLAGLDTRWAPPVQRAARAPRAIADARNGPDEHARAIAGAGAEACAELDRLGIDRTPPAPLHGDWHPGNTLFDGDRLVALLDFDAAGLGPPAMDHARVFMQFAAVRPEGPPESWTHALRLDLIRSIASGMGGLTPGSDTTCLVPLMVRELAAETLASPPGSGGLAGPAILSYVRRRIAWLLHHRAEIEQAAMPTTNGGP